MSILDKMMRIAGRGIDGTAKPVQIDNKGKVIVNAGMGNLPIYITRIGNIAPNTEETIFVNTSPTSIDYLEFATNFDIGQITIEYKTPEGIYYNPIGQLNLTGSAGVGFTPRQITEYMSSIWTINSFETGKYKFTLKDKWYFPLGVRIKLKNNSATETITIGCRAFGREY